MAWTRRFRGPTSLRIHPAKGDSYVQWEPYCFAPLLSDHDLYLFSQGKLNQAWRMLGAAASTVDEVEGVRFAVWAPNAERVSVVGDFNAWDGRRHPMRARGSSGVWELFIPGLKAGDLYKYEIRQRDSGDIYVKTDPYAQAFELRPSTAAQVVLPNQHVWQDAAWLEQRSHSDWLARAHVGVRNPSRILAQGSPTAVFSTTATWPINWSTT